MRYINTYLLLLLLLLLKMTSDGKENIQSWNLRRAKKDVEHRL